MKPTNLVVAPTVAPIRRQRLDDGVHDLQARGARGRQQRRPARAQLNDAPPPILEVGAVELLLAQVRVQRALSLAVEVLDVDQQQARLCGITGSLAQVRLGRVERSHGARDCNARSACHFCCCAVCAPLNE